MSNSAKRLFIFTIYRVVLFSGVALVLVLSFAFMDAIRVFYFGEGNVFRHSRGQLAVHFLDVGNGDATVIQFPSGRVGVIDGGPDRTSRQVIDYIHRRVVRRGGRIDFVISTHPNINALGGLPDILKEFRVDTVYRPIIQSRSEHDRDNGTLEPIDNIPALYTYFIDVAHERANNVRIIEQGHYVACEQHNYRLFFHTPTTDQIPVGLLVTNEISPIITLEFGGHVFVFTGRAGPTGEGQFMQTTSAQTLFAHAHDNDWQIHLRAANLVHSNEYAFLDFIEPTTATLSTQQSDIHHALLGRLLARTSGEHLHITQELGHIAYRVSSADFKIFTGFENPWQLWWLFFTLIFALFVVTFFDFKPKSQPHQDICEEPQEQ